MKGDFSKIHFVPHDNFNGILPQQGKVLLDSDGTAQTLIENDWHVTAARDWVGPVAGVPFGEPDSFKISAANLSSGAVSLTVGTGHLWADGLLVRLGGAPGTTVTRSATWLEPSLVPQAGGASDVAEGTQDTVILEVWQHAVNGYQMPDVLIEPALGGPDTAERLKTSFAFRLARMKEGETCSSVTFDESGRGKLTASLVPPVVIGGDCPVEDSGGYSGFEHQFYRIEIANTNGGGSQFKWSRVNGGLVGRGSFDPVTQKITILANLAAITSYRQTSFYLEIETYDEALGYSRVVAGTNATLSGGVLQCDSASVFGSYPSAAGNVFFRLWDGLEPVSSYPVSATPVQLESGILLQFEADGTGKYFPGDYWTFPVRAQGITNPQTLIDAKTPKGIVYHRIPLAEITWTSVSGGNFEAETIEDCRVMVPPLTRTKGCCMCRVGDGIETFGDFTSIQAAIDSLPEEGGEVCILPGRYFENVYIINRKDIVIHGCGWHTRVASKSLSATDNAINGSTPNPLNAVFTIAGCMHIELRDFVVEAADDETGILIDGTGASADHMQSTNHRELVSVARRVTDVSIKGMILTAARLPAILAMHVQMLTIEQNRIAMKNVASTWPAVFVSGQEIHIEKNIVNIQSSRIASAVLPAIVVSDLKQEQEKNEADTNSSDNSEVVTIYASHISTSSALHPGGIQIGGESVDVYVIENEIEGGSRNGITLGSLSVIDDNGDDTGVWIGIIVYINDDCCTVTLEPPPSNTPENPGTHVVAGGVLKNIHIHRNRIRDMGLCGIGPVVMFNILQILETISIDGLSISRNEISRTLMRPLANVSDEASISIGYGAICIPDVVGLTIYDNTITDFGERPGVKVCGILIIHGEQIDISRNKVLETRDWGSIIDATSGSGIAGGISVLLATPPEAMDAIAANDKTYASNNPIYEHGLPAVRIEHNVVRVPLAYTLSIIGIGPMSIVNNHLSCGGYVQSRTRGIAQTVLILNLGTAIDSISSATNPSNMFYAASNTSVVGVPPTSNGTLLFTNNICQLEARISEQRELSSIVIVTSDHLLFANNECWLDGLAESATLNALLAGATLQVISNRFQETLNAVPISGLTSGKINVTAQNISTHCLLPFGTKLVNTSNLVLASNNCEETRKYVEAGLNF